MKNCNAQQKKSSIKEVELMRLEKYEKHKSKFTEQLW